MFSSCMTAVGGQTHTKKEPGLDLLAKQTPKVQHWLTFNFPER